MASIYALCASSELGLFAVPYRTGRRRRAMRLPDGAIAEEPLPNQMCEAPANLVEIFEVGAGGVPATIHHANLGLVTGFLTLSGVYLLPGGEIGAVFGAVAIPIGADNATKP